MLYDVSDPFKDLGGPQGDPEIEQMFLKVDSIVRGPGSPRAAIRRKPSIRTVRAHPSNPAKLHPSD
jgi:hypothetical protein